MPSRQHAILPDEYGATAVEYALMLMGVFVAVFAIVGALGLRVQNVFTTFLSLLP